MPCQQTGHHDGVHSSLLALPPYFGPAPQSVKGGGTQPRQLQVAGCGGVRPRHFAGAGLQPRHFQRAGCGGVPRHGTRHHYGACCRTEHGIRTHRRTNLPTNWKMTDDPLAFFD